MAEGHFMRRQAQIMPAGQIMAEGPFTRRYA